MLVTSDADGLVLRVQLGHDKAPRLTSFENDQGWRDQNLNGEVFGCLCFSAKPCASEEYVPVNS